MANDKKEEKIKDDKKEEEKEEEKPKDSSQNGYSEEEVRKESSKAAKQAKQAHDKATELMQAAAAAGDPEERQKLMEEALEQQIQSKSLGKTAKYLRSGTFQGMAVGAGLGIAPGASLGAITGTLVGGVSSTALGGLGAGLGAATGWMHGPFWDMGKGGGKLIQKITGNLPGWKATEAQKKQLEKMLGQINEQDAPGMDELESMGNEGPSEEQQEVMDNVKAKMPSLPSGGDSNGSAPEKGQEKGAADDSDKPAKDAGPEDEKAQDDGSETKQAAEKERKKPRKLQPKPEAGATPPAEQAGPKKKPRKLEKRSE